MQATVTPPPIYWEEYDFSFNRMLRVPVVTFWTTCVAYERTHIFYHTNGLSDVQLYTRLHKLFGSKSLRTYSG
jgi:hypothetical protein